ncbi:hypothetical protein MKK63_04765 [Methylobacterium sp. J-088]|uniref:hypothetical protein n=1 Tax=unclassified Methylobacterium TaxID=2615210 RepID=UPI001FBA3E71|nr:MULTISPECIES: hypothetical protein [unclassified Methylobacterium]MCJ2062014.1 hypothetical protein [Methylobacterium sp. J-088]
MPSDTTRALSAQGDVGSVHGNASRQGFGAVRESAAIGTVSETQGPILEPWRILALALIVAAGMLFVHLVVPADAASDPARATPAAVLGPQP